MVDHSQILITHASSKGSDKKAHAYSLAKAFDACIHTSKLSRGVFKCSGKSFSLQSKLDSSISCTLQKTTLLCMCIVQ